MTKTVYKFVNIEYFNNTKNQHPIYIACNYFKLKLFSFRKRRRSGRWLTGTDLWMKINWSLIEKEIDVKDGI